MTNITVRNDGVYIECTGCVLTISSTLLDDYYPTPAHLLYLTYSTDRLSSDVTGVIEYCSAAGLVT